MKKTLFSLFIIALIYLGLMHTASVFAEVIVTPPEGDLLPEINKNPGDAIASIIQFFILLTGVLAVIAITWWGIKFILSTGDDEKMKKARYTIIYAFVGVVVAWLAYSLVEIITKIKIN